MEFYSYLRKTVLAKTGAARQPPLAVYNPIPKGSTKLGFLVGYS